ncbi:related to thiamine pyrophosphate-requiring enzymes [acetolactate synthase, pyruvate dehydrogenase (cytochrome), glyoxylate carboligase, phosphonopyruvate decarboxylase] [Phialocephala subalpina]|uniref:Related to thiamine pyrophosphate-requiring enzymes [acetolactate synthase, pyruvate dehydrogenase (Cytochrome), glyoxylate carboligase, phosphonopyruvate decarboxylase] n=1 Tax=Phialocephala subalpina TaxID=576137 RepID=A0A1L7X1I3_9HELO|nr:related to thiamine pyrophosphate-requiring enzymes [acetolactate synthase, pyruvate dehydrogenase (cytochrome), glyoxylate carboligase, phosphonopyruvate decarboxylase] [Phialocephala subalpina]
MPGFALHQPEHRELSGGDLLAQSLKQLGVDTAFGIHGGHLDAFLMGCDHSGIRLVDTRHETVAVQAAEGYAKVSGKVGVCFVTANSGYYIYTAYISLCHTDYLQVFKRSSRSSDSSRRPKSNLRDHELAAASGCGDELSPGVLGSSSNLEASYQVLASCYASRRDSETSFSGLQNRSFWHSRSVQVLTHLCPRPSLTFIGPVLIDFPIEILFSPIRQHSISWGSICSPLAYPPAPSLQAIHEAIALWKAAKRPVIIISTGCRGAEASKQLIQLAEATQTPVFQSMKGFGSIPIDHPLQAGTATNLAKLPYMGKPRPDLIFMLGARTGMFLGGRSGVVIPDTDCKLIQIDIDGSEIGRTSHVDVGIVSDTTEALKALNASVHLFPFRVPQDWVSLATSLKNTPRSSEKDEKTINGIMHPYHALKAVFSALEPGSILSFDGGESGSWASELTEVARPSASFFAAGYLGMLGNGFGYSLGAAIASPGTQIVNIQGDGSAGFHLSELDTYARHKLNILTVVVNNYVWGMSIHGQELVYGDKNPARPVSSLSPETRYDVVAAGFGQADAIIEKLEDIERTVKRLSEVEGPACINLIVSDKPTHAGTVAMVSPTDDPNMIVVPYYDNIPRPYYK